MVVSRQPAATGKCPRSAGRMKFGHHCKWLAPTRQQSPPFLAPGDGRMYNPKLAGRQPQLHRRLNRPRHELLSAENLVARPASRDAGGGRGRRDVRSERNLAAARRRRRDNAWRAGVLLLRVRTWSAAATAERWLAGVPLDERPGSPRLCVSCRFRAVHGGDVFKRRSFLSRATRFNPGIAFEECSFRNDALSPISSLQSIERLSFWASDIGDRDLRHVSSLRNLKTLNLSECREITGSAVQHWSQLSNLKNLYLDSTQFDDAALAELSSLDLPRLRVLSFSGTNVSDRALQSIIRMRTLDTIFVGGHTITRDGLRALYAARPELTFLN